MFTTWPELQFGMFFCVAYFVNLAVSGISGKTFSTATFRERLQNMDRRHLVAAMGITVFALPLIIAAGIEVAVGVALAGVSIVLGSLMIPSLNDDHFECRRDFIELRSGEKMRCDGITVFSGKPLFLIESSNDAQLVGRRDLAFQNVLEASQHFPASDGAGAK